MTTTVGRVGNAQTTNSVYIGRPSKWGNPFIIGQHGTREEVCAKFKDALHNSLSPKFAMMRRDIGELRNKELLCYCHPMQCHGHVLAELAEK